MDVVKDDMKLVGVNAEGWVRWLDLLPVTHYTVSGLGQLAFTGVYCRKKLQENSDVRCKSKIKKETKNIFLKYVRHNDALKYIGNMMWLKMHFAILMSFSSKFVMCVEGCHGDSFAISVDRYQH